ncbi:alkaline phosphatase family protein [Archangium gephyra]|uniref:alkaline phosphatase D family protein n=1 Tax=Archangium gephyra TaxID=48 RepID=UPI0035D3E8B1
MAEARAVFVGACTRTSARITVVADANVQVAHLAWSERAQGGEQLLSIPLRDARPYRMGTFELSGLTPGATLRYAVDCQPLGLPSPMAPALMSGAQHRYSFRLLPADEGRPLRVVLLSCNAIEHSDERTRFDMWRRLRKQIDAGRVDLLIHCGDQIYADDIWRWHEKHDSSVSLDELISEYRDEYVRLWGDNPDIRGVLASCPSVMMWDDHDIYDGYGSNDDDDLPSSRRYLQAAAQAFRDFQAVNNPPLDPAYLKHRDGTQVPADDSFFSCFRSHGIGFLLLDGRSNRNYHRSSVLGANQHRVLDTVLDDWRKDETLRWVYVVVGVPVVHAEVAAALALSEATGDIAGVKDDLRDNWVSPNNLAECGQLLTRLFDFMVQRPKVEVTILAGDAHVGAVARIWSAIHQLPNGRGAPEFYQVTSSGIAHPAPSGIKAVVIKQGAKRVRHSLMNGEQIQGALMPIPGNPGTRILWQRNFALLKLGPGDGTQWDPDQKLRVEFHAEGKPDLMEMVLVNL